MREDVRENRKESGRYGTPRLRAQGSRDASAIRRWANALNTLAGAALCGLEACARGIRVTHDHYRYSRILHERKGAGDKGEMGTVVAYSLRYVLDHWLLLCPRPLVSRRKGACRERSYSCTVADTRVRGRKILRVDVWRVSVRRERRSDGADAARRKVRTG